MVKKSNLKNTHLWTLNGSTVIKIPSRKVITNQSFECSVAECWEWDLNEVKNAVLHSPSSSKTYATPFPIGYFFAFNSKQIKAKTHFNAPAHILIPAVEPALVKFQIPYFCGQILNFILLSRSSIPEMPTKTITRSVYLPLKKSCLHA